MEVLRKVSIGMVGFVGNCQPKKVIKVLRIGSCVVCIGLQKEFGT